MMTINEKKSVLDGRIVDLQRAVEELNTAINCYNDAMINKAFDTAEYCLESARSLYDEIYDNELEAMGKELEKEYLREEE